MLNWAGTAVLLSGLGAYFVVAGPSLFSFLVGFLALGGLVLRGRLTLPRPYVLPGALVLSLLIFLRPADWPTTSSFVGPSSFSVATFLAFLVALALYRRHERDEVLVAVALGPVLSMASGMTTQLFPYGLMVALQAVFLAFALRAHHRGSVDLRPASLLVLVPALVLAGALAYVLKWSDTQLNSLVQLLSSATSMSARFPTTSTLSGIQSIQGSDAVAARIFSSGNPPDYLVGRCYLTYSNNSWRWEAEKETVTGGPLPGSLDLPANLKLYRVRPEAPEATQIDRVELPGVSPGAPLLVSRDAPLVAADIADLNLYHDGVLQVQAQHTFDGVYYLLREPGSIPAETLADQDRQAYLQLPDTLSPVVAALAKEIAAGTAGDLDTAAAMERYLQENFTYGFGYPFQDAKDPLEKFLTERPAAHCEFFASALALMLRTRGIPSRYVVGFMVTEKSPFSDYSIVRVRHAHAWVEAYIGGMGWVRFDPTPPGALREPGALWGLYQSLLEAFGYARHRMKKFFQLSPAQMLKAVGTFFKTQTQRLLSSPVTLVGLALFLVLAFLWKRGAIDPLDWLRSLFRRRSQASNADASAPHRLSLLLAQAEGLLALHGVHRKPSQTLLEWSRQLQDTELLADEQLRLCQRFLAQYCLARYGGRDDEARLRELLDELHQVLRKRN